MSKPLYEAMNLLIEKKCRTIHIVILNVTYPGILLPRFLLSYFLYFTTDLGNDSFTLPVPVWLSILSWKTPYTYPIMFIVLTISSYILLSCCKCVISLFIGLAMVFMTFIKDMELELQTLKENNKTDGNVQRFRDFVQFHAHVKKRASEFTELYSTVITGYYLWSIITIGVTLLIVIMETSHHQMYTIELIEPIIMMFWSFIQMFVFCNFGEHVNSGFKELSDALYCCDWYCLPYDIRRMLPIVMIATQKPAIRGSGDIPCSRESFSEVLNNGFEYFRIVREIGHLHAH
ncbi:odorant receptor coreceptor-like isoform X2 [Sitodiplosis mosellana]|nr:odorant receptor coreceptor-like isoform X2 [Sitodiplosis mosellana]